jgi:hypothetical protein
MATGAHLRLRLEDYENLLQELPPLKSFCMYFVFQHS